MPFRDVLVHRATPVLRVEGVEYVEGEAEDVPGRGTPFDCCLFLPDGRASTGGPGRQVKQPTLLVAPTDDGGLPVSLSRDDELMIVAAELNLAEGIPASAEVRYQVTASGQPFGRPGRAIIGKQVMLSRVEESDPETAGLEE